MESPFATFTPLLPLVVIGVVVVLIIAILSSRGGRRLEYPYERQAALFTPAERSFMGVLQRVVGDEYQVFGKVRLADLIKVERGVSNSRRQTALNRITSKHVDFVLCAPHDLSVVCAIELDDSSHQEARRQRRDAFVDKAFGVAGIPLLRFPVKQSYALHDVQVTLAAVLSQEAFTAAREAKNTLAKPSEALQASPGDAPVPCPECGEDMVVRTAKRGANAGQEFLACSAYPKCRKTMSLN